MRLYVHADIPVMNRDKKCMRCLIIFAVILMSMMTAFCEHPAASVINPKKADRLIWCGDSRTAQMGKVIYHYERESDGKTMVAEHVVAKAGSTVSWASTEGYRLLEKKLKKEKYKDAILIMNWGVNQIQKAENSAKNYVKLIKKIHKAYPNVLIYVMSVNPVEYNPDSRHVNTTEKALERKLLINQFNKYVKKHLPKKVKYIDTYHNIDFAIRDGIHYTIKTYREIVNYVIGTTDLS